MKFRIYLILFCFAINSLAANPTDETYLSIDEAAIAFVNYVRSLKQSEQNEFCAFIVESPHGFYQINEVSEGTQSGCYIENRQGNIVANVHTHPKIFGGFDLSAAGQLPSDTDFAFANSSFAGEISYLGAPAGHIIKYIRGGSSCRGNSWIKHSYELIQQPEIEAYSNLEFASQEWILITSEQQKTLCQIP